ncbi:YhcB family protein [Luminiphilus sp.]|nr:YhcB family protein [Luminiphilus sp.]
MYSLVNLIIALIIGGAIGSLIGWYSALASRGDNKRKIILELESQLDQARQNKVDYEAEVTEHFSRTADLLNKLTDDYRSVYTHLANGADQLCGDQISMSEPALSAPPHDETDKPQLVEVAQPLDYAPKKPDEQGQLSETFGLEKSGSSAA